MRFLKMPVAKILLLIMLGSSSIVSSSEAPCEDISYKDWWTANQYTCIMRNETVINSNDFVIREQRNYEVAAFDSAFNKKIEFLPQGMAEVFPNLDTVHAQDCAIGSVSKENFRKLKKLRVVSLSGNKIKKLSNDLFEDNSMIESIFLDRNRIKAMNGRVFASLYKLLQVHLKENECIAENFVTTSAIARMPRVVTEKCGYYESTFAKVSEKISFGSKRLLTWIKSWGS